MIKKPGRPPVSGETLDASIHVLTTKRNKARAMKLAKRKKVSLGRYVRDLIDADLWRDMGEVGK